MNGDFSILFLGTGTSTGVPLIGCGCEVCRSRDPRDERLRSSALVTLGGRTLLLDAGPDFRAQCLRRRVSRIDAVFITHAHADHLFGFDDIRRFNTMQGNAVIPCYAGPDTIAGMHRVFPYITQRRNTLGLYRPLIDFIPVTAPFEALGARLTPLPVIHGSIETNGLRIRVENVQDRKVDSALVEKLQPEPAAEDERDEGDKAEPSKDRKDKEKKDKKEKKED